MEGKREKKRNALASSNSYANYKLRIRIRHDWTCTYAFLREKRREEVNKKRYRSKGKQAGPIPLP